MSVAALVPRVREALGVSTSYDAETIPALIRRCIKRLLRDYHFPKALVKETFTPLAEGDFEFDLPSGFKKEYLVNFYDSADDGSWSDPLLKSEGFRLPEPEGYVAAHYWLEGTKLLISTPITSEQTTLTLQLYYESWDVDTHEDWFTEDFEDVLFYYSVLKGAAEMRKPEVLQAFAALWEDERTSLAIYANELQFDSLEMRAREPRGWNRERYPR